MTEHLIEEQQKFLLRLARRAIEERLKMSDTLEPETEDPALAAKRGAFVTLKVDGILRGCIGYPLPYKSLVETIVDCAVMAATQDYRFKPVSTEELSRLLIEISVLSIPRPVKDYREVKVGEHGIIISKGHNKGLLLPQVPVEHKWNLETFLKNGCQKAGLNGDEWKQGVKIEVFSAQVFSEKT